LFATALGLVAAIPAVLAYNKISSDIGRFGQRLENFAVEFGTEPHALAVSTSAVIANSRRLMLPPGVGRPGSRAVT